MIITNRHKRHFLWRSRVPRKVMEDEFSYLSEDQKEDGFIHYRGQWYHAGDFMPVPLGAEELGDWDGYLSDSFFSGIVIELLWDDLYRIGTYIN